MLGLNKLVVLAILFVSGVTFERASACSVFFAKSEAFDNRNLSFRDKIRLLEGLWSLSTGDPLNEPVLVDSVDVFSITRPQEDGLSQSYVFVAHMKDYGRLQRQIDLSLLESERAEPSDVLFHETARGFDRVSDIDLPRHNISFREGSEAYLAEAHRRADSSIEHTSFELRRQGSNLLRRAFGFGTGFVLGLVSAGIAREEFPEIANADALRVWGITTVLSTPLIWKFTRSKVEGYHPRIQEIASDLLKMEDGSSWLLLNRYSDSGVDRGRITKDLGKIGFLHVGEIRDGKFSPTGE